MSITPPAPSAISNAGQVRGTRALTGTWVAAYADHEYTGEYCAAPNSFDAGGFAAIPGIDWFSLSTARVQRLGTIHMALNLILVALFTSNAWLRLASSVPDAIPLTLSIVGVLILGVSGWLGGEMVYVHRVGVAPTSNASSRARQAA
jgi:uncharacterized membrane protein